MRFCENCGHQLDNTAEFCENCGTRVNRGDGIVHNHHNETTVGKKKTKVGIIIGAVIVGIVVLIVVGGFIIYPKVTQYMQQKENQEKAERVIELIDSVNSDEISLETETELNAVKVEYDSLTEEQKKLVDNYGELETAYDALYDLKEKQENQEKAQNVIDAINGIDASGLMGDDTSVQSIREEYNNLTDAQKELVTNLDKLEEYEEIVQQKRAEKAEKEAQAQAEKESRNEINEMFETLLEFEGVWGDFGSHVNKYEGLIESAIKSSISLSDYFGGDVNEVYMYMYRQGDNAYFIRFEGPSPSGAGQFRTLECTVVPNDDGTKLQYIEGSYY